MSLDENENNQQNEYYEHESGDDQLLQSQEDDTGHRSVQSDQDSLSPEFNSQLDSTQPRENQPAASSSADLQPGRALSEDVHSLLSRPRPTESISSVVFQRTTNPKSRDIRNSDKAARASLRY